MSGAADLALMRASMLLDTDPAAAARDAAAVLLNHPGHDAASLLLSAACRRLGDASRAIGVMQGLAQVQPASAIVQWELGRAYAAAARGDAAKAAFERAVELDANLAEAWRDLSEQRLLEAQTAAADQAYDRYRRLAADPPDLAEAYAAFDQGRLAVAEALVQQRLGAGTNEVAALTLLAAIALRRGDELAEEASLNQLLSRAPCDSSAREQLVRLLIRQGRTEQALPLTERLLAAQPGHSAYSILKMQALQFSERHGEGLALITQLLTEHPENADLWLLAGNQQRYIGQPRAAIDSYLRAIALRPAHGMAYWALSNLESFRFSARDIESMHRQRARVGTTGADPTGLEFTLGKALEELGDYAAAFAHYERGNQLARATFDYDKNAMTAFVRRFKATFTGGFFSERSDWGGAARDPIFIVGLPRSGSTLLEQILASHSAVEGTRELPYVPVIARELAGPAETAARYPENLISLDQSAVQALAARYLAGARKHRVLGKPRFVDKMHANFTSLGLIHMMFPQAAIIDCRRHPLACGFACYKQIFNAGLNFAYDLDELGRYYRDYAELMDHIDTVLPGRIYRLHYEKLVTDTEAEVRRILGYCGLPFEPGCLRFHENERVAQTISSDQVRRPIYTAGLEQWRHFEPWLDALKFALGDLPDRYPRFQ